MEEARQLDPEIQVCAPVTSLPLRAAIVTSPIEVVALQAWEAQDIAEEQSSHWLITQKMMSFLLVTSKQGLRSLVEAVAFP